MPTSLPQDEYTRRLSSHVAHAAQLEKTHSRLATSRLLLFVVILICAWAAWSPRLLSAWWLLAPVGAFAVLVVRHASVRRSQKAADRAAAFYKRGIARIEDRWAGQGATGERFDDPHHVYSSDLDLFGRGSVFQLLSTARTRMGEATLARWLLNPSTVAEIRERHACIAELRHKLELREDLALLGDDEEVRVQPNALLKWARSGNPLMHAWLPVVAFSLPALLIVAAVIWNQFDLASPFVAVLAIEIALIRGLRTPLNEVLYSTESAFEDLRLLAALPERLEREAFSAAPLQALVRTLHSHELSASQAIGRLATIVQWIESRRNPLLALLQIPLLYPLHTALAAQRWRSSHGDLAEAWLSAIGQIEALNSIAAFSYEHPADVLPQFVAGPATFVAQSLGHPLIPAAKCIRNDVQIVGVTRMLLISGSNMSGKSTLMRSVGINAVLAMAGAPVRAKQMTLTPLQVGASIRINDSLHEGSSRFYAEIQRLRQLHDLSNDAVDTGRPSLLFLLDEVLQGTNSTDRHIGAKGVVRAFMEQGAIGLISTHDLTLTDIDGAGSERLHNVHFQDELVNGRLMFDFRLRQGIVTRSNGVELMRSIGLKV